MSQSEQRKYPRHPVILPARLGGYRVETANVSVAGAQVSMPSMRYTLAAEKLAAGELDLELSLPDGQPLSARCRLTYRSEYDDDVLLGVVFVEAGEEAPEALRAYLRENAGPRFLEPEP